MEDAANTIEKETGGRAVCEGRTCTHVVEILKAVAHPVRLRAVALLCDGEKNVSELTAELGVSQAIVSQQLRILRMSSLVEVSRHGGYAYYSLAEPHLRALIQCMEKCCAAAQ